MFEVDIYLRVLVSSYHFQMIFDACNTMIDPSPKILRALQIHSTSLYQGSN